MRLYRKATHLTSRQRLALEILHALLPMNDNEISELKLSIQQSKIERAEALTFAEKLREGADLYDESMRWIYLIIKADNPDYSEEQIDQEIERRKRIARRIDDNGLFQPCGVAQLYDED